MLYILNVKYFIRKIQKYMYFLEGKVMRIKDMGVCFEDQFFVLGGFLKFYLEVIEIFCLYFGIYFFVNIFKEYDFVIFYILYKSFFQDLDRNKGMRSMKIYN